MSNTVTTPGALVEIMEHGKWVGPFRVTGLEGRTPEHLVLESPSGYRRFEHYNDAPYNTRLAR